MEQIENNSVERKAEVDAAFENTSVARKAEVDAAFENVANQNTPVESNIVTTQQQEDYTQESVVHPVPAQNQLPADSYLYANTTSIGGVIQSVANQYDIDPHKLEALTNTIRNKQANLSGFYSMQIGYYPGMSAESLVTSLGRVADLSNTVSDRARQEAEMKGLKYNSNGLDDIVDSLQSIGGKKSGKMYYQEALSALQEADHIKFDTQTLTEYYETLVKSGVSKADAWTQTMRKQDLYRAAQDERAVKQDFDSMITPASMDTYATALYTKIQQTSDPETRLRLYGQYQTASKLAKSYTEAFKNDPAAYLQAKDPSFKGLLANAQKSGNYSEVVSALDARYDEMQIPTSQRKYLTKEQTQTAAKEINTFLASDPIKAQATIVSLNKAYGKNAGKVINQLITEGKVDPSVKVLVEATKTGSPANNEDVLNMLKNKMAYKGNYAKEMLGAPDNATARTMRQKIESRIYGLPGYKALVNQLNLVGNVTGKIEMAQYYADMALYYKSKNPGLSDKQAVEKVQKNLIDSVYVYDAQGRSILQKRTLNGKPIQYNKYSAQQAVKYLTNRQFTGQGIQIGNLSKEISERVLRDNSKISYRMIDQHTVQPIYDDGKGTVQALFTGTGKNRKVLTFNLKQLGDEDILGVIDAKNSVRKLVSLLTNAANIPSSTAIARGFAGPLDKNTVNAMQALNELGFNLKNFDSSKPFNKQFDRTQMSPRRIEALSNIMLKQQEFELKLQAYERLKRAQREAAAPRLTAAKMVVPFIRDIIFNPSTAEESRLYKQFKNWTADSTELLPELKRSREELYKLENDIIKEAGIFLNYKGTLPKHPLTKQINEHAVLDKILWGGY